MVNFLKNIPLTEKQRKAIIHKYIRKNCPNLSLAAEIKAVAAMYDLWIGNSSLAIEEVWQFYQNPQKLTPKAKTEVEEIPEIEEKETKTESFRLDITLNAQQQLAVDFASSGKSFVLTGAAGTGKTTTEREIVKVFLAKGNLGTHEFKDKRSGMRHKGPGIAVVSFTNKAAATSKKAIHKDLALAEALPHNITTIHNLLEFAPEFFERPDGTTGMRFIPTRNRYNLLDCKVIIIEEASTVGALDLYQFLYDAMRPGTIIILVGDINQLPPIFSPSILNYALVQLPIVELTEIYRQAADSPIISNAWNILEGKELKEARPHFTIINGAKLTKIVSGSFCVHRLVNSLRKWIDVNDPSANNEATYDPDQDMILSPYNKNDAGTVEINKHIAQFMGLKRNAKVHHIIAGMHEHYLAVGDRVFFFKREAIIETIAKNGKYIGRAPKMEGVELTRWGMRVNVNGNKDSEGSFEDEIIGYENLDVDSIPDDEEKKQAASHIIHLRYVDDASEDTMESAGDFAPANFSLGYALTAHKAQGSEWRKVFILIHRSQIAHLSREWLYTAVTRARTHCLLIDFTDIRDKVIKQQRIKGNNVAEKVQWFNSEISLKEPVKVLK